MNASADEQWVLRCSIWLTVCVAGKVYTSYVLKTGRARFIEIHVVVPPGFARDSVATFDAVRTEISEAIGGEGRERWLTVAFTANEQWI